jgi:RNA polymerase sigma-70 factor (TIGR02943 family)
MAFHGRTGAAPATATDSPPSLDPGRWVEEHGDCLYRYALVRVRKPDVAEDLVQETFLSAVRNLERFAGHSSVRSWLCGILKHKLGDHFRKLGRETSFTDLEFLKDECDEKFSARGFWYHDTGPLAWKPEAVEQITQAEFWQTLRDCLGKLPKRIAAVFTLREMDELETEEICRMLSISPNNLWVMLHRARMGLRECLEINWFAENSGDQP